MPAAALPVLYSFRRCPYAMRARLALIASDTRCELREIVLRDKPAGLLAASPKGTVPVLVMADGTVLEQSLDIMLWALRRNDPLRWLQPDAGTIDDLLALVAACDGDFKPQLDRYKYPNRCDDTAHAARERGAAFLRDLEARLSASPHLAGARATLADAALMPFVRQFAMVDAAWFDAQPWPRLHACCPHGPPRTCSPAPCPSTRRGRRARRASAFRRPSLPSQPQMRAGCIR